MKRSSVALLLVTLAAPSLALAAPSGGSIAGALGNLRWGMNDREVKSALHGKIKDRSAAASLDSSYVEFDGKPSRYDNTPIGEEYTHGNEEAMLSYKDADGSENYYFLIGGQLWKWVKLYPTSAFGGSNYGKFSAAVQKKFGTGHEKEGEVNPGSGQRYKYIEFLDRNTRLRAVDKSANGKYALMFESMDTVRGLASLRANTIRRGSKPVKPAAVAQNTRDDDQDSAPPSKSQQRLLQPAAQPGAIASANKNKKSIFTDEQNQGDTAESYQSKKQRVQQEARDRQRRTYERGEEQKKGKVLDSLAGVDDDDPISGMP
jgi:hypothetical protein